MRKIKEKIMIVLTTYKHTHRDGHTHTYTGADVRTYTNTHSKSHQNNQDHNVV